MEYLTDLVTTVPDGTSQAKVDELRGAEAARAAELAKEGHLIRLWRPPLNPVNGVALDFSAPPTKQRLNEILESLPLHIWMKVTITPLTPHPNDPKYGKLSSQGSHSV